MCRDDIKVTFEIPIDKVDRNFNIYSKEVIEKAILEFKEKKEIPLLTRRSGYKDLEEFGIITDMKLVDNKIIATGNIHLGGYISIGNVHTRLETGGSEVNELNFLALSLINKQFNQNLDEFFSEKMQKEIILDGLTIGPVDDIKEEE